MLSNKNDYDNFEHLKLSIEKPRGQLLCYIQYTNWGFNSLITGLLGMVFICMKQLH